jgi:hypothetical protein
MYYSIVKNKDNEKIVLNLFDKNKVCWYSLDFLNMEYYKISNSIYKFTRGKVKINNNSGFFPIWDDNLKLYKVTINNIDIYGGLIRDLLSNVQDAKRLLYI